jgi:SAM-dependent methyltransferase
LTASWVDAIRHACPRCRSAIELPPGRDAACPGCGFVARLDRGVYRFVPPAEPSGWQATYDQVATGKLADTAPGLLYRSSVEHRVSTYRRLCGDPPAEARILDLGCANGVFAAALFGPRPIAGIDFSFELCVQARARGMLAHQANALALPFADAQFDLVCVAGVLEHIDDLTSLCAEIARVCRPGGSVILGTGYRNSLARRLMRLVRCVKPAPLAVARLPLTMRSLGELRQAAEAAGLRLARVCWTHFPLTWQWCSRSPRNPMAFLASNVYARFEKPARG